MGNNTWPWSILLLGLAACSKDLDFSSLHGAGPVVDRGRDVYPRYEVLLGHLALDANTMYQEFVANLSGVPLSRYQITFVPAMKTDPKTLEQDVLLSVKVIETTGAVIATAQTVSPRTGTPSLINTQSASDDFYCFWEMPALNLEGGYRIEVTATLRAGASRFETDVFLAGGGHFK